MARSITVIPAKKSEAEEGNNSREKLRVAAYCRVSTDQEDQLHSFASQVEYYTKYINDNPSYEMAGIYADEGISGTNTKKREQFRQMIADCEAGKIDRVITKSISRFARNTQDCLEYSRKLKALGISIYFEKEHINTMDASGEVLFTILSSLAQDESRNISENCKWGIRTKFRKGIPQIDCTKFLGYDKGEDGRLVINEEQAVTVRRIYKEFLEGYNPFTIAKRLNEEGISTGTGRTKWYVSGVLGILRNEKHKGDALLQKTYTEDFLTKKMVKNTGQVEQIYVKDSHPAIIDKEQWEAVQLELERREAYIKEVDTKLYGYGANRNPFSCRVVCGHCNALYGRKSWGTRGVHLWQCKNHIIDGKLNCKGRNIKESDLNKAFIKAWNQIVSERESYLPQWEKMQMEGNPLEKLRARQMIELTNEPLLTELVPELVQLVFERVVIKKQDKYEFYLLDGTYKEVTL
jgi:site-specific DNA recombinase